MPAILKRLPIHDHDDITFVGNEHVRIKAKEIVASVSLTSRNAAASDLVAPCFPVILDTGHTHDFSIQESHLIRWAGLRPELLGQIGHVRHVGKRLPLRKARVWLYRNAPGKRERLEGTRPFLLDLPRGIAVYPDDGGDFPHLPLLGMGALFANKLHLAVDGKNQWANLRTQDWWTRLLSWLS